MNFYVIGFLVLIGAIVSFVSGRFLWGFVTPLILGAVFLFSDNPRQNFAMEAGVWAMAAIPLGVMGLIGAFVGSMLSPKRRKKNGNKSRSESM